MVLRKRQDKTRAFFDDMAGRLGREYVPGRSWKSIAEALLLMVPPMVIADLGAGEGAFSLLLAQRAQQVIAVDNSDKMVELGSELARKQGVPALEYRKGDLEAVPIADGSVDLALFSQSLHHAQHPERAVAEAWRILKPGGRIAILDLVQHRFAEARELYADVWLGFSEVELEQLLGQDPASETCTPQSCTKKPKPPFFRPCWRRGSSRFGLTRPETQQPTSLGYDLGPLQVDHWPPLAAIPGLKGETWGARLGYPHTFTRPLSIAKASSYAPRPSGIRSTNRRCR